MAKDPKNGIAGHVPPPLNVEEYWTPERRAAARPLPMPSPSATYVPAPWVPPAGPPSTDPPEDSKSSKFEGSRFPKPAEPSTTLFGATPVDNLSVRPYNANGKLFLTADGVNYVGSAALIRKSIAITAAHCLHTGRNGGVYTSNVAFYPQYPVDEIGLPRGFPAVRMIVPPGWYEGDDEPLAYDFGYIKFDADVSFFFGPPARLMWNAVRQQRRRAVGYPLQPNPPFDGTMMWTTVGNYVERAPGELRWIGMDNNNMGNGASGGGWHVLDQGEWYTNGVFSFHFGEPAYSVYFDQAIKDLLDEFVRS